MRELRRRFGAMAAQLPQYEFSFLFIDNASRDGTVAVLRELAAEDPRVKVIVNAGNFGHLRSSMHGFLQAEGDAVAGETRCEPIDCQARRCIAGSASFVFGMV